MPVPKKRRSKSKKRIKGACWKIEAPHLRPCPTCHAMGRSHHICLSCGYYKGKAMITIKIKESKKES